MYGILRCYFVILIMISLAAGEKRTEEEDDNDDGGRKKKEKKKRRGGAKLAFPGISGGIFSRESGTGEIFHREDFSRNIKKITKYHTYTYLLI